MAWSDVANKIKSFGSEDDGLDGLPATVNGLAPYRGAFSNSTEKSDILVALKDLYDNSDSVRADAGDYRCPTRLSAALHVLAAFAYQIRCAHAFKLPELTIFVCCTERIV